MEETGVPVKIIDLSQLTDKLYHIHFIEYISFELTTLVVIGTDCTGSWRSNYYAITTTAAPLIEVCYIYYIMWMILAQTDEIIFSARKWVHYTKTDHSKQVMYYFFVHLSDDLSVGSGYSEATFIRLEALQTRNCFQTLGKLTKQLPITDWMGPVTY